MRPPRQQLRRADIEPCSLIPSNRSQIQILTLLESRSQAVATTRQITWVSRFHSGFFFPLLLFSVLVLTILLVDIS